MTTLADELRTAAKKLRALAGQATPAPWVTTWRGQEYQLDGNTDSDLSPISQWTYASATWEPKAAEERAECDTADADYIAAMHPGVGALLARLLDVEADVVAARIAQDGTEDYALDYGGGYVLDIARLINGTTP